MDQGPDAVVFDLDGVIMFTARLHAAAWKELFDNFLRARAVGEPFLPFDADRDYREYVDGRPRYEGVLSFLTSRGIHIPYGTPSDPPFALTVCGLGNQKNEIFNRKLREVGVEVDQDAVRLVRELRSHGVRTGLASSSKNAVPVLETAGIRDLFDAVVDGIVSDRLGLRGKPQPDIFLQCLAWLTDHVNPLRAAVVEDAIVGIEAGRLAGFGLVLGVDRNESGELARHHADWVITSFREITAVKLIRYFKERLRVA